MVTAFTTINFIQHEFLPHPGLLCQLSIRARRGGFASAVDGRFCERQPSGEGGQIGRISFPDGDQRLVCISSDRQV